ncbi:MAG: hypothetical protein V1746_03750 [bacterium]
MDADLKSDLNDAVDELQDIFSESILLDNRSYRAFVSEIKTQESNQVGGFLEEPVLKATIQRSEIIVMPIIGSVLVYQEKAYRVVGITSGPVTLELDLETMNK